MIAVIVLISLSFTPLVHSASSGAKACDALGLCSEASSRAHFDTELNEDGCKLVFTSEETMSKACGSGSIRDPVVSMPGQGHTQANCTQACLDSPTCNYVTWRTGRGDCRLYETCEGIGRGGHERYMKYCPDIPYICPYGMHKVAAPVRSDDYFVGTADFGESGSSEYIPGELMDIHVRSLNPAKKFLGILIYAVQNDGIIGEEGCPSPGCDGKEEIKVGEWEATDIDNFQVSCDGKAMTHTNAKVKKFHHVFRWRAPQSGSGDVIFRVIVKTGSTNGGWFYWPMETGDLMLFEGVQQPSPKEWVQGNIGMTCEEVCQSRNQMCDRSVVLDGSLDLYEDVKTDQSCQLPLLSKNTASAPSRDADGFCYFQNSELNDAPTTNICDASSGAENEFESERLCPCIIDSDASRAPTADRPTNAPTLMTTVEATPVVEDSPSASPSTSMPTTSTTTSETYTIDWTAGFGNVIAQSMEAEVGDSLIFNDVGGHNIYLMPSKAAFDDCDFSSATLLSSNNGYQHMLTSLPMYFACRVGSHCRAGQKLAVTSLASTGVPSFMPTDMPTILTSIEATSASAVWELIASTYEGDNGCGAQRIADSRAETAEVCQSRCFEAGATFVQFHSTGFCGCFATCPLTRDASRYNSPADVFQLKAENSPTKTPSMLSTIPPSKSPETSTPTEAPSMLSNEPSEDPSTFPTTELPSFAPSATSPSANPSKSPTYGPTSSPTESPSQKPSAGPTTSTTTEVPSFAPSAGPSKRPTYGPTSSPTEIPSESPSVTPSVSSTTNAPTSAPTSTPSVKPSSSPKRRLEIFQLKIEWVGVLTNSNCAGESWRSDRSSRDLTEEADCLDFCEGYTFVAWYHTQDRCRCYENCDHPGPSAQNFPNYVYTSGSVATETPTSNPTFVQDSKSPSLDDFGTSVLIDEDFQETPSPSPSPIRRLLLTSAIVNEDSQVSFVSEWHFMLLGIAAAIVLLACCMILYLDVLGCYKRRKQDQVFIDVEDSKEVGGQNLSPSFSTQYFCIRSKVPSPNMKVLNEAWDS